VTRALFERHQVWLYLAAILAGLGVGTVAPATAPFFQAVLWPTLGLLLYATFTQVPLDHLPRALRDRRFMAAVLSGSSWAGASPRSWRPSGSSRSF
jgi:arsenite transporter